MSGAFGRLNSRNDFQRSLADAISFVRSGRVGEPSDPARSLIEAQLDAMQTWTAGGRVPTPAERGRVAVGTRALREFSDTGDAEIEEWLEKLCELDSFLQGWPSDREAATSTDGDALALLRRAAENRAAAKAEHESKV